MLAKISQIKFALNCFVNVISICYCRSEILASAEQHIQL